MTDIEKIPEIWDWVRIVEEDKREYRVCKDQHQLVDLVRRCFREQPIHVELEKLGHYMQICRRYVPFGLFEWEKFVLALHDCTYWTETMLPRWPDNFCMIGRGAGKDGMIACESFCLSSPYNGIREYDVDICANNEDQALRPVKDLKSWLEDPKNIRKTKKHFYWTQEKIECIKTHSIIRGRTNSPKGKDGLRSGIVILNEIHQYQNYANIDVFTTGLGKKPDPRRSYYTTNGDVRDGPLDDTLRDAEGILQGDIDDNGMLPFVCRLDDKSEVDDESNWTKANPSLPYMPHLLAEIRKEYREWKNNPDRLPAFMSKRMNLPDTAKEAAVTDWDNIAATNKPIPELNGWACTVGIDYSKTTDWVAVNAHFRNGHDRFDINHAWICRDSKDTHRIKAPWRSWVDKGMLTFVDDVEIHPSLIAEYVAQLGRKYSITLVAIDNYRYSLMADALSKVGFNKERGNLRLIQQRDIIKIVPVIDHCFINGYFHWGDNPMLRWATNNTKTIRYGRDVGADKGSFVYAKIEAKSRKTDPFMALVASMVFENEIKQRPSLNRVPVIAF